MNILLEIIIFIAAYAFTGSAAGAFIIGLVLYMLIQIAENSKPKKELTWEDDPDWQLGEYRRTGSWPKKGEY